ncbi:MAG: hypothetical protein HOW73_06930 [Polyangiaceae bacterium]|nr:hypothetical protein [Polyangiaceae bacterium]
MARPLARFVLVLGLALAAPACAAGSANGPAQMPFVQPAPVSDEAFAGSLLKILGDGSRSEERQKLLLGVVRRQLLHAKARFSRGAEDRATQSVFGAMFLMRAGEHSPVVVDAETSGAIDGAITRLSARGDIGRAKVLYTLRTKHATPAERKEIEAHLAALEQFKNETLTGKPIERAGDAERTSLGMALLAPEHIDAAVRDIDAWIALGIQGNVNYQETGKRPSPEEAIEIARSLGSGAATIVALMLRYGDVQGAIDHVLSTNARRVTDPAFFASVKAVEQRDDASSWRDLYDALATETSDRVGGEIGIDPELYAAARFASLVEAYRRDPKHARTALELSRELTDLGMAEVAPLLVDGAISDEASTQDVVQGVRIVARAIIADSSAGDVAGASRTIAASTRFLDRAKTLLSHRGGASAIAELRYSMASIVLQGGYVEQAESLLTAALDASPKASGYLVRAQIYRQTNAFDLALADIASIISTKGADPVDVADARLLEFDIRREQGQADAAKKALASALSTSTAAVEQRKSGGPRARALAALGRVLQAYGDRDGARKAFERALEAAAGDRELLGSLMLQAASSSLALGDRTGVKMALQKGVDAGARQEDLVYGAIWVTLADKQTGASPDEAAFEILEGAAKQPTWVGRLAAWARGKLSDEALALKASNEESRVEATFYVAMAKRARGTPSEDALRLVASSPLVHSPEVKIARELLAPRSALEIPKDVKIP